MNLEKEQGTVNLTKPEQELIPASEMSLPATQKSDVSGAATFTSVTQKIDTFLNDDKPNSVGENLATACEQMNEVVNKGIGKLSEAVNELTAKTDAFFKVKHTKSTSEVFDATAESIQGLGDKVL